ncbi:hypothetical protein AA0472_2187 [Acetobacter estunensis NRIC 0472]|uniref:Uncharacterized protein n=1 Tax=Acetobacter estunensis TaxID=104097 RepID=A0A967BCN0_9PROT|nr:hypothetical protein [Acetobacter estunensis]NHO54588.1 hypothetical protein [Acetobacter estunensis]GBQ26697.1 hypothetical protein AA0472_2187 [Acetobacter estunensis NRIC 0472]
MSAAETYTFFADKDGALYRFADWRGTPSPLETLLSLFGKQSEVGKPLTEGRQRVGKRLGASPPVLIGLMRYTAGQQAIADLQKTFAAGIASGTFGEVPELYPLFVEWWCRVCEQASSKALRNWLHRSLMLKLLWNASGRDMAIRSIQEGYAVIDRTAGCIRIRKEVSVSDAVTAMQIESAGAVA